MTISIIMPTYNVAPYIRKCLESVAAQTYTGSMECLIVDDCGPDNSIQIAEEFIKEYNGPTDFRIIHREKNGGLSAARNSGIHEAKGEYLYFLDSDDMIYPHTISTLVTLAEKYPGVDIVQGNIEVEPHDSWQYKLLHYEDAAMKEYWDNRDELRRLILSRTLPMTAWNKLVRKTFIVEHSLYFLEGYIHEDEMWRWDYQKYIQSLAVSPINTIWYRIDNQTSIMANGDKTKSVLARLELFKRMALTGETDYEYSFVNRFGTLDGRYGNWNNIRDKKAVMHTARNVFTALRAAHLTNRNPLFLAFCWQLPFWVINNRFFIRFYYEWKKRNIFIYK